MAFLTSDSKVNREELSGLVDLVDRYDTPIYSMINNTTAKSIYPEWTIEDMEAPGENAQEEGRDYSYAVHTPAERAGNYTQIYSKTGRISRTQEEVDNAGSVDQINRTKVIRGKAIRTDVEYSLVTTRASVDGSTRFLGSLPTWAETNVSRGAGGINGGFDPNTKKTVEPTDGTQRAFSKTLLDDLLQAGYSSGARLEHMFLSPYNKRVFAEFMSDTNVAQFRYAAKGANKLTLIADAEVYLGPLGMVYAHPNHVMGANAENARNVIVLDIKRVKYAWLTPIKEDTDAAKTRTGDHKQFVLNGEGTVKVMNEKAVGVIADVYGLNATT